MGVAPINKESGIYKGQRKIHGGRSKIRIVMYIAMLSGIQCKPIFKLTYQRLVSVGKPKKIAIIVCVRKMIVILNSMVRYKKWFFIKIIKNTLICDVSKNGFIVYI